MELLYDDEFSLHAYQFTPRAKNLSVPAKNAFPNCHYFPEEFSILVTLKVGRLTKRKEEWLFSMATNATDDVRLGVKLSRGRLVFVYSDHVMQPGMRRMVAFRNMKIFDRGWHTLILSVSGNRITLRTDCGKRRSKKLKRAFPALVNTRGTNFHIGNSNDNQYTVSSIVFSPASVRTFNSCTKCVFLH